MSRGKFPVAAEGGFPDKIAMTENAPLIERIDERLAAVKLSASAASKAAGLSVTYIKDLRNRPNAWGTVAAMRSLASVLETTVEYLIGDRDEPGLAGGAAPGFQETSDATQWHPPTAAPGSNALDVASLAALLCPSAIHPAYWRAANSMPGFGIFVRDLLIVDLKPSATAGELVLVNSRDQHGGARTLLRRHVQPYLVAPDPDGKQAPLLYDNDQNAIMGVVVSVIRAPELAGV